ncbi:MAG: GH3 auxin-responsive promoter family protein [Deltaproteobacteria bacterium]|nr:GH3 auxin-responsive promoter family protein [Deltaproteobacteria bacterium]
MAVSDALARMYALVDDLRAGKTSVTEHSLAVYGLLLEGSHTPRQVQTDLLLTLLAEARDTEIGRTCGFAGIDSIEAFRRQVPVHLYEDLRPFIERMCNGEPDVLLHGLPGFVAQTSGTTGSPKLVPWPPTLDHEFLPFLFASFGAVETRFPGALTGRQMILSRFIEGHTAAGIPVGSASGYVRNLNESIPGMARVPGIVFDEQRFAVRYYAMLLYMLSQPLAWLAVLNPSTLLTFIEQLDLFGPALAQDLAAGTWTHGPDGIDDVMRVASAQQPLVPAPERAARMRDSLARDKRVNLEEVCPELRVLTMWKGGNAKHYLAQVRARLPTCEIRSEVSGSSEGALLIPLDDRTEGGVPALFSTFIEFLPAELEPSPEAFHDIEELKPEQGYRFVVTNRRSMYRLLQDDVFFLERYEGRTPVLRFSHRHGMQSSITGEKLTEWQIIEAVQAAEAQSGLAALDYQARPEWGEPPGYVMFLELDAPADDKLQRFVIALEHKLHELNLEYASKRSSSRLAAMSLIVLARGELREWQKHELAASGKSDAQAKIPRLRRDLWTASAEHRRIRLQRDG